MHLISCQTGAAAKKGAYNLYRELPRSSERMANGSGVDSKRIAPDPFSCLLSFAFHSTPLCTVRRIAIQCDAWRCNATQWNAMRRIALPRHVGFLPRSQDTGYGTHAGSIGRAPNALRDS